MGFSDFWRDNWPALVPLVFFLFVNPWSLIEVARIRSAKGERLARARDELAAALELQLREGRHPNVTVIRDLAAALERKHRVEKGRLYQPADILRDVSLRIEQNPHLEGTVKAQLAERVQDAMRRCRATLGLQDVNLLVMALSETTGGTEWSRASVLVARLKDSDWSGPEHLSLLNSLAFLVGRAYQKGWRDRARELAEQLRESWSQRNEDEPSLVDRSSVVAAAQGLEAREEPTLPQAV